MHDIDVLEKHLFSGFTHVWTKESWDILEALAEGVYPGGRRETAVSNMLASLDGRLGSDVANILLGYAGVESMGDDAALMDIEGWPAVRAGAGGPDIFVKRYSMPNPVLAVEVKQYADVNGAWGKCPFNPDGYSNQLVCYPHKHWAKEGTAENTLFLWIRPGNTKIHGITDRLLKADYLDDWHRASLTEFKSRQDAAIVNDWHHATWEQLVEDLDTLDHEAAPIVSRIIRTWNRL